MYYAIDKIEDDIIVCESLELEEKIELSKEKIQGEIHEGAILVKKNDMFYTNEEYEQQRREIIKSKLEQLKKLKDKSN